MPICPGLSISSSPLRKLLGCYRNVQGRSHDKHVNLAPPLFCKRAESAFSLRPFDLTWSYRSTEMLDRALAYARRSKFLRFGLPFLSFMVLGSFGLAEFTEIRVSGAAIHSSINPLSSLTHSLTNYTVTRPPTNCMYVCTQVKKQDEKTHMLTAEETLQFQKKVNNNDYNNIIIHHCRKHLLSMMF